MSKLKYSIKGNHQLRHHPKHRLLGMKVMPRTHCTGSTKVKVTSEGKP